MELISMDRRTNVALTAATFAIIIVWVFIVWFLAVPDLLFWVGGLCITAVVWVTGKVWASRHRRRTGKPILRQ